MCEEAALRKQVETNQTISEANSELNLLQLNKLNLLSFN